MQSNPEQTDRQTNPPPRPQANPNKRNPQTYVVRETEHIQIQYKHTLISRSTARLYVLYLAVVNLQGSIQHRLPKTGLEA